MVVPWQIHNRRLAITRRGLYCLVPGVAEEGDMTCILYGTMTPFILRKPAVAGLCRLLGEAFITSSDDTDYDDCSEWLDLGLEEQDITIV